MLQKQKGIALGITLVMLLMLTILGLFAMQTSTMEEKMASNTRDHELAFQAAETALRDAENWLRAQTTAPLGNNAGTGRVWTKNVMDPNGATVENWWQERNWSWWKTHAVQYAGTISTVATQPYTIIEYLDKEKVEMGTPGYGGTVSYRHYYRVTAMGTGGSDNARVLLQSVFYGVW